MSIYLSEEEQIERIKSWWKKYANLLLIGLLVIAVIVAGWRWWQQRHQLHLVQASMAYEQLLVDVANENMTDMEVRADDLITSYADTIYAQLAVLLLAQQAVYSNDLTLAEQHLQTVIERTDNKSLQQMARIRAARVWLADGQAESALAIIEPIDDKVFLPLVEQVKGDIYTVQQMYSQARQAYRMALDLSSQTNMVNRLLQMKLNNLPGAGDAEANNQEVPGE